MVKLSLNRRRFIASLGAFAAMPQVAQGANLLTSINANLTVIGYEDL